MAIKQGKIPAFSVSDISDGYYQDGGSADAFPGIPGKNDAGYS